VAWFAEFTPAEWAFFVFIVATIAVFTGAAGSYHDDWVLKGAGSIFLVPIQVVLAPLASLGAIPAAIAVVLFFFWISRIGDWLTHGFIAAILVGVFAYLLMV